MGDEPAEAGESPWDFAKRQFALGFRKTSVIERLVAEKGLSRVEAELLLSGLDEGSTAASVPSANDGAGEYHTTSGFNLGPLLGTGLMAVGGSTLSFGRPIVGTILLFGGIVWSLVSFGARAPTPKIAPSRLRPLPPDETVQRCGRHPELASLGACPRCGAFACLACAPLRGYPELSMCGQCDGLPSVRLDRVSVAKRLSASAMSARAFLWLLTPVAVEIFVGGPTPNVALALVACAVLVVLSVLQFLLRSIWPAVVALVVDPLFAVSALMTGYVATFGVLWFILFSLSFAAASNHRARNTALVEAQTAS